jgi:hypothetical protein
MNPSEPRVQAAVDAALNQIWTTAASVAERASETLGTLAQSAQRVAERDLMLAAQFDLRRNMRQFHAIFKATLADKVGHEIDNISETHPKPTATDWHALSLVDDREVEERMSFDKIAQLIAHECESEVRELAAYMGTLLRTGRADEERNPLRAEVLGKALYRAIEATSDQGPIRKLLARDMGLAMARAMPACYGAILRDLQGRGIQPVGLSVRTFEGPGHQLPGINSAYATLPKNEYHGSQGGDFDALSSHGMLGGAPTRPWSHGAQTQHGETGFGPSRAAALGTERGGVPTRSPALAAQADAQLMTLLRRLTVLASQPGELDSGWRSRQAPGLPAGRAGGTSLRGTIDTTPLRAASASGRDARETLAGLMAVNLIHAHRDELLQASPGRLDHMVIDVVGSLFDQILSDARVPPQMARQLARLQLPVLRVALNDSSFFSSRRHPVRRFVNRIASLACAFDQFDDGPGKQFLDRVRELVQEIIDGDFDQVHVYTAKLGDLERFIGEQTQGQVQRSETATTLESKESELRIQQRYMLELRSALTPLPLLPYLRDFLAQVWSQAIVLASRRDGADSDRAQRYKRAGRDLVMSVQPKGSPALRKKFLMQLPPLMKDLNEGMQLVGWPTAAQKDFFAKLLPAHAESLKGQAQSELDHNMLVKQLEGIFGMPVPGTESLSAADTVPEVDDSVIHGRFSSEEARQVGLVAPTAVDWDGHVDIDLAEASDDTDSAPLDAGLDVNLVLNKSDPDEPTRGPNLIDHVRLGFAYQMLLKDEWQKVRLTYVSPGRSFFVFTRGKTHQETISMTARMLARMCETSRMRAVESAYLMERATQRARKQLASLKTPSKH